jgi:hypothetical protein
MKFTPRAKGPCGEFLKLGDKESVTGVFRGDPYKFSQHWVPGGGGGPCTGKGCELCAEGAKKSFRFRINFLQLENGDWKPKIFEQGGMTYDKLADLHAGGYDLERTIVTVTRKGSGKETEYAILPKPKGDVTPEIEKKLSAIKLVALTPQAPAEEQDLSEDIPF